MNSPSGTPPNDFTDSDLEWYAALNDELPREAIGPAAREGRALRVALELRKQELLADPGTADAASEESSRLRLQELKLQMRKQGLFEPRSPDLPIEVSASPPTEPRHSNVVEFPWWRRRPALVALAASVLLAVVVLRQFDQADYPEPPVMQGAGGVQAARAAQPRAAAEAWAAQLRGAGLRPGIYQRGKRYVVDVNLLAAELPAAEPAFATLQLKPAPGFNRVEFSAVP